MTDHTMRKRIVLVDDTLRGGGAERHLLRLVAGLLQSEVWDPRIYCLSRTGLFVPHMEALGVEIAGPSELWSRTPRKVVSALPRLHAYLRRTNPLIAHCYLTQAGVFGSVAARLAGVPIVITTRRQVHGYTGAKLLEYRVACAIMDRCSDVVISVCEAARQQAIAEGTPPGKIITIYNGLALPQSLPAPQHRFHGTPVIGTVATLVHYKGQRFLIEAMANVLRELPAAHLVIVGDGEDRPDLERQTERLGLQGHVTFLGERHDVPELLPDFDIFALPSVWEGLPNVILEAMAARRPIVATAVGGTPEMVLHEETGLLVPPCSPGELAAALIRMATDAELRRRTVAGGQQLLRTRFDPDREIRETISVYDQLLHAKSLGREAVPA